MAAVSFLQPEKAFAPIVFTLSGRVIFFKAAQPLNAPASITVIFLPIETFFNFEQPEKAFAPIVFTFAPMAKPVMFLLFCIAFEPIEVTL